MYFAFNIAVFDRKRDEIRSALTDIMKNEAFNITFIGTITVASIGDLLPEPDEKLMLRKFLLTPKKNGWTMIYPSTGWFSEVQDLSVKLSKELDCVAMVLLVDDSYGWGYELSQQGNVIDRFHTHSIHSPTLKEKNKYSLIQKNKTTDSTTQLEVQHVDISTLAKLSLPTSEQIAEIKRHLLEQEEFDLLTPEQKSNLEDKLDQILANSSFLTSEQKAELIEQSLTDPSILGKPFPPTSVNQAELEKYSGNPSILANVFGILEELVVYCLSVSESDSERGLHDKMATFFELLGIEDGDGTYQDLIENFEDSEYHMIFVRDMTAIELQWREKWKEKLPYVAPPLWVNRETQE